MKHINGDLVVMACKGDFTVIVHGCNCFHTMNAGIAKTIRTVFPSVYEADIKQTRMGDSTKLGTYSYCEVKTSKYKTLTVINAYTQYYYSSDGKMLVNYEAILKVFKTIASDFPNQIIGIPKIGAGLAGGNWETIERIIDSVTPNLDITLVEYKPNENKKY